MMRAGQSHLPCVRYPRLGAVLAAWLVALALPLRIAHGQERIGDSMLVAPVAARSIPRGAELVAEDVVASDSAAPRVGWIARRVIRPGEVLREPAVVPPPLVRRGQPVQYRVTSGGISVTVMGTAMADASLGEVVSVRLDERRRVDAVVAAAGLVVNRTVSR